MREEWWSAAASSCRRAFRLRRGQIGDVFRIRQVVHRIQIRTKLVTRNAGNAFHFKHTGRGHALPLRERLGRNGEFFRQGRKIPVAIAHGIYCSLESRITHIRNVRMTYLCVKLFLR